MPNTIAPAIAVKEGDVVDITALLAVLLATGTVHLFKSGFSPNYVSPEADFAANEADFVGYAPATIATWSAIVSDSAQEPLTLSAAALFTCTAGTTPNVIAGLWLETVGNKVVRYFVFDNPVNISLAGQFMNVEIVLKGSQLGYADVTS